MLTKNLQFQYALEDRNQTKVVLKQDIRALCLNASGLEILHLDSKSTSQDNECVHVVRGANLDLVWDDLVFNRLHSFVANSWLSNEAFAGVTEIVRQKSWSVCVEEITPEQNKARKDCLEFESKTFRHLWQLVHLEALALQKGRSLLLQFRGNHSYILTPRRDMFEMIRDQILDENLDVGCVNQFTVADPSLYPDGEPKRYVFQTVEYRHVDLAGRGDWDIQLDLRWSHNRLMRQRSTMGMDHGM